MRAFSSQRRRQGRQRGAPHASSASSFTDPTYTRDGSDVDDPSPGKIHYTGIPAGWMTDPSGRHEQRYWSGSAWTEHVTDGGTPGIDPPPGGTGREAPS